MAFSLNTIVPWGRSFAEYKAMFALSPLDLEKKILGCGDGPAGFNAVLTGNGGRVTSADPIYAFTGEEIRKRIKETFGEVMEQAEQNRDGFVWKQISSVKELGAIRMAAMEEFLADFQPGRAGNRYIAAFLPDLPFGDGAFDLALCSHFLFLYSEQLSEPFHIRAIKELCRVAGETRLFPLLELDGSPSRHLEAVLDTLGREGYRLQRQRVPYEFQRGGNEMLQIISSHRKERS